MSGKLLACVIHKIDGQDLLEYGLLGALIAVVALAAVKGLGDQVDTVFWQVIAKSV